jgi:magnesium and cobalt exporter, CNNM family
VLGDLFEHKPECMLGTMNDMTINILWLLLAAVLVGLNGFFVAAEFALVKIRLSQVELMVDHGRPFAATARWLLGHLDAALSVCQLGITMASLALGWIGEPAFARLLTPLLLAAGVGSEKVIHSVSFVAAFTLITALHITLGEQVPKIYAIRRPESMILKTAPPLKFFYFATYPLVMALNSASSLMLRGLGLRRGGHADHHTEAEIRALLHQAYGEGELSRIEHRLIEAVFEFDDKVSRRVMVPRSEVVFLDAGSSLAQCLELFARTHHTRYPVCEGSLDRTLGIANVKDFLGVSEADFDLRKLLRPAPRVPETMPISQLLRQFQSSHQHMALVVDEYGNNIGLATLETVLEQIVGPVEDEFDREVEQIVEEIPGRFLVEGGTALDTVARRLGVVLESDEFDTFSGYLVGQARRLLETGDRLKLEGFEAEIVEAKDGRATRVRVTLESGDDEGPEAPGQEQP